MTSISHQQAAQKVIELYTDEDGLSEADQQVLLEYTGDGLTGLINQDTYFTQDQIYKLLDVIDKLERNDSQIENFQSKQRFASAFPKDFVEAFLGVDQQKSPTEKRLEHLMMTAGSSWESNEKRNLAVKALAQVAEKGSEDVFACLAVVIIQSASDHSDDPIAKQAFETLAQNSLKWNFAAISQILSLTIRDDVSEPMAQQAFSVLTQLAQQNEKVGTYLFLCITNSEHAHESIAKQAHEALSQLVE